MRISVFTSPIASSISNDKAFFPLLKLYSIRLEPVSVSYTHLDVYKRQYYQLISMSINPLDDFRDGEQYLYILNGSKKRKERVSTFAIFSNADEIQKI